MNSEPTRAQINDYYPPWSKITHFLSYKNGALYFTENCTRSRGNQVRSLSLKIDGKTISTAHIIYRYENGIWPPKGRINPASMAPHFGVTLEPELRQQLTKAALEKNVSMASIIRVALRQYFRSRQNAPTTTNPNAAVHRNQFTTRT